MSELNHREYYLGRAEASRRLAMKASDPKIAALHRDFAERYETTASQLECIQPAQFAAHG